MSGDTVGPPKGPEAIEREYVMRNGQEVDVAGLGLLAFDWARRREAMAQRLHDKGGRV